MGTLIFSEGNGYGHVARDKAIADRFGFRIMTFGKGAEYCRMRGMDFIEIPSPYRIEKKRKTTRIVTELSELRKFVKPDVMSAIADCFKRTDVVIVDGSPLGLVLATAAGKRTILIANDISAMVGVGNSVSREFASQFLDRFMKRADAVLVPDFSPPLTVTMLNLQKDIPLEFIGPLTERSSQKRHRKKYVVSTLDSAIVKAVERVVGDDAIYASDVGDIRPYYRDCGAVICHGGHTAIMDSLSYGKPPVCVVDGTYSERVNHAAMLERLDVGVSIDKARLSDDSLRCALDYAGTLNQKRLSLYKRTAERTDPLLAIGKILKG
ncbi:Uncharacterised protein [uncultured archaeon]|nr:Uncharacterised protein [uncultured archaeon]